jgi:DNA-binding transcriptional MerR regulator
MRIGELAERAGTTARALRHYESLGLLRARRAGNGYRAYDDQDLRLLRQIRTLRDFGFELEDTRPFVDCLRAGHPEGDSCPASVEVYQRKLAELDEYLARLTEVRGRLASRLAHVERAPAGDAAASAPRCEFSCEPSERSTR